MLAPFLLSIRKSKEEFVATKSFCQGSVQTVKVFMFLTVSRFDYLAHSEKIVALSLAVVCGSWYGKKMLHKISEQNFLMTLLSLNT